MPNDYSETREDVTIEAEQEKGVSGYGTRSNKTGTRTEYILCSEDTARLAYFRPRGGLLEFCVKGDDGYKVYLMSPGQIANAHV